MSGWLSKTLHREGSFHVVHCSYQTCYRIYWGSQMLLAYEDKCFWLVFNQCYWLPDVGPQFSLVGPIVIVAPENLEMDGAGLGEMGIVF